MANIEHEILVERLKDNVRNCSLLEKMDETFNQIMDIRRKTNPSKNAKAYVEEEEAKLNFMQDLIKRCIWDAFSDDEDVVENTTYYDKLRTHYDIQIIVKKRT